MMIPAPTGCQTPPPPPTISNFLPFPSCPREKRSFTAVLFVATWEQQWRRDYRDILKQITKVLDKRTLRTPIVVWKCKNAISNLENYVTYDNNTELKYESASHSNFSLSLKVWDIRKIFILKKYIEKTNSFIFLIKFPFPW